MFLQVISASFFEEELVKENGTKDSRTVLKLPPPLAPVKIGSSPAGQERRITRDSQGNNR